MTWGMHAIGHLESGNASKAAALFNRSFANVQQPFAVWTETPTGGTCAARASPHQFSDRRGWLPSDGAVRLPRAPDPRECASFAAEADRGHDRDARARRSVPWQHVRALVRRHHTATDASCPAARGVCALRGRRGRAQKPAMRAQGGRRGAVGARSGPRPVGVVRVSWTVSGWRGR
eukprot:5212512-Prymnesium_polylepis.1